ncbi:uncharacterized protein LOC103512956 [Diaphorina citri]|uniref:Uncharacterized protein LOC103512956 n=1 Tax=Diaphorina citri TaxID=121845 RepID=A0A1S3D7I3_DIACI|nr:uncharacterized protein LOC103512956 [Diaphorina citri]
MDTTDLTEGRKLYRTVSACLIVVFSLKNVFTICMEVAVLGSILSSALCILPEDIVRVHLFSDILFVLALANLAQSIFGVRLSVMHTTSFLLLCPILYYLNLPANKCPSQGDLYAIGPVQRSLEWQSRLHQLHGCFILIAVCQSLFSIRHHGLAALSMPHNTHMSRLILVVTMTTLLDHVTSDQSVSADTLDLVSAQPARAHNLEANETLNECRCEQNAAGKRKNAF